MNRTIGRTIKPRSYKRRTAVGPYRVVHLMKRPRDDYYIIRIKKPSLPNVSRRKFKKMIVCFIKKHDLDGMTHKFNGKEIQFCYRCVKFVKI